MSTHNSLFAGIPKLKGASNYDLWHSALEGALKVADLWSTLQDPAAPNEADYVDTPAFKDAQRKWKNKTIQIEGHIQLSFEADPMFLVKNQTTAQAKLKKLGELYKEASHLARSRSFRHLTKSIFIDFKSVTEFGTAMTKFNSELTQFGYPIPI